MVERANILHLFTTKIDVSRNILGFFRALKYKKINPKSLWIVKLTAYNSHIRQATGQVSGQIWGPGGNPT